MDNLICTDCGTTYYSAAAIAMIERGERCDCGAPLALRVESENRAAVGARPEQPPNGSRGPGPPGGRGRFSRESGPTA